MEAVPLTCPPLHLRSRGSQGVRCAAQALFSVIFCFPQKSLPLLENQIKENHEKITEELQKYGSDVPEDEHEKMLFLIDVSTGRGIESEIHTSVSGKGLCASRTFLLLPGSQPRLTVPTSHQSGAGGAVGNGQGGTDGHVCRVDRLSRVLARDPEGS